MKIILTGATGFIGHEILSKVLANKTFTSVVVLSRRPIPDQHPKLTTVVLEDFTVYPSSVINELSGAQACIWTIGVKNVSPETHRLVTVDYTSAAAKAFENFGSPSSPFRLVFMSGILAVRDPNATALYFSEQRRLKGEGENIVIEASKTSKNLDAYILRPGGVLSVRSGLGGFLSGAVQALAPMIAVDRLAAAAVQLAVHGNEKKIVENAQLVSLGKESLAVQK